MANNSGLMDAAIAGLSGGSQERWLTSDVQSSYQTFANAIAAFATAIDAAIPSIPGGTTAAEANLLQGLCQGISATRMAVSVDADDYVEIAEAVAAVWQELRGELGPAPPVGAVTSVFSRTGDVVAEYADYNTDLIENTSGVSGTTLSDALDALLAMGGSVSSVFGRAGAVSAQSGDYTSTLISNLSSVTGATVTAALNALLAISGVSSVFGRVGTVSAQSGDYTSTLISNLSSVTGATVTAALNALLAMSGVTSVFGRVGGVSAQTGDYTSTQITNSSGVSGTGVTGALDTLNSAIGALVTGVSSVFGRTNAVTAQTGDYNSTQITNSSAVSGTGVTGALNTLLPSATYHWGVVATAGTTAARFFPRTFGTLTTTEANAQITAGRASTITSIRVSGAVSSATDSLTLTLRVNGVSTAVTCTIAIGATSGSGTGFSLALVAGDRLSMQITQSGTDVVSTWNGDVTVY